MDKKNKRFGAADNFLIGSPFMKSLAKQGFLGSVAKNKARVAEEDLKKNKRRGGR